MKKIILIALFTCLVVSLVAIPVIAQAETTSITRATVLQSVVAEKLGVGDYTYELLAGFSDASRYTLVEGDGKYLIFDNVLQDFVEYSDSSNSYYYYYDLNSNSRKMYLGPTYYFYQQDGAVIDMTDGQQLDESAVAACALYEQESSVSQFSIRQSSQQTATAGQTQAMSDLTNEEKMILYFSNLRSNMGINSDWNFPGSCGVVAIGMMLSYFDTFRDDNIIYDKDFDAHTIIQVGSHSEISMANYLESPGTDRRFQRHLIDIGVELGYYKNDTTSFGLTYLEENGIFNRYLTTRNIDATVKYELWESNDRLGYLMSEYGPLLLSITYWEDEDGLTVEKNHALVAYEYTGDEIIANFGWWGAKTHTNIANTKIRCIQYVKFENDIHSCSDNYRWAYNGEIGSLCPCGNIDCKHNEGATCVSIDAKKHEYICNTCGITNSITEHNYVPYQTYYKQCVDCLYILKHTHRYTYRPSGKNTHAATCSVCGGVTIESCMGFTNMFGETRCRSCGQIISDIIINSEDEEE